MSSTDTNRWPVTAVAGWLGVLGPVVYVLTWATAGALAEGYHPARDAISELAEIGAATAPAMNTGFVLFGVAVVPFASAVRKVLPSAGRALHGAMLLTGAATVGAAAFPCSPGCPGPAAGGTDLGHSIVAAVGYLALIACPFVAAWNLRDSDERAWGFFRRWSLAAGLLAAAGLLVWGTGLGGSVGGAWQRASNTMADAWWVSAGLLVVRRPPQR